MSRLLAPCALALACLALALRIFAPQGYMVAHGGEGRALPIVLCTGQGLAAVFLDDQGQPTSPDHGDDPSTDHHAPCVFATTGTLAYQPPATILVAVAYAPAPVMRTLSLASAPGPGLSAPPPPSTGPPIQA